MKVYKVLVTCNNEFVDENLLEKGVYTASVPKLHSEDTDMESYVKHIKWFASLNPSFINEDNMLKNLQLCKFVPIEMNFIK